MYSPYKHAVYILRDFCMGSCSQVVHEQVTCPPKSLRLICFAFSDAHAIPLFVESKILSINTIYFDTVASLMHDIWKELTPSPMTAHFAN